LTVFPRKSKWRERPKNPAFLFGLSENGKHGDVESGSGTVQSWGRRKTRPVGMEEWLRKGDGQASAERDAIRARMPGLARGCG